MYYVFIYLLLIVLMCTDLKANKIIVKILNTVIIFILSFPYNAGIDWLAYKDLYENIIPNTPLTDLFTQYTQYENGFLILNLIFSSLGIPFRFFLAVVLVTCMSILFRKLYNYSTNYYLSLTYFLSFFMITAAIEPILRQLIALTIIIFGYKYIEKNNTVKFCFCVLLAAQFHKSAYIFMVIYLTRNIVIRNIKLIVILIFFIVLCFNIQTFLQHFPFLGGYAVYLTNSRYNGNNLELNTIIIKIFYYFCYLIPLCIGYRKYRKGKNYIFNLGVCYIFFSILMLKMSIFYRLVDYFIFAIAIIIPECYYSLPNCLKHKYTKIFVNLSIVLFSCFHLYRFMSTSNLKRYEYLGYKNYVVEKLFGKTLIEEKRDEEVYQTKIRDLIIKENKEEHKKVETL